MVIASTGSSYIGSQATEGTVPVEVLSLESLIEQARIDVSRLRLVKLDIEGGEVAIVRDLVAVGQALTSRDDSPRRRITRSTAVSHALSLRIARARNGNSASEHYIPITPRPL